MQSYTDLIKALRHCTDNEPSNGDCWNCPYQGEKCHTLLSDAAAAIEALQAEVEWLKDSNEELREKQTYIDHYGNKWMTSAKDVPTAAYEHGYADGLDEAMAKMEVQE